VPETITISINGVSVAVPSGVTIAAALARAANAACPEVVGVTRRSVTGAMRAPLCGMGVCQECRVTVDGRAHVLACQTLCCAGMQIGTAQ
jgi:aerobic-type carbon monoxide dehydrogenase small subunit (CoxS/CutS family)